MSDGTAATLSTLLHTYRRLNVAAGLLGGLAAGLTGALVFTFPYGLGFHLLITLALGVIFGLSMGAKIHTSGGGLIWGQSFGTLWWLFGSLLLVPLFSGMTLPWTIDALRALFPELLGWAVGYGSVLGLTFYGIRNLLQRLALHADRAAAERSPPRQWLSRPERENSPPLIQAFIVGGLGGLLGSWVFAWGVDREIFYPLVAGLMRSTSVMVGTTLHYLIGGVIGVSFGLLFNRELRGPGPGLAWGVSYGLTWWVLGPLTLLPLLLGAESQPEWTREAAQSAFSSLISHVLYGALVGYLSGLVSRLWQVLFIDSDPLNRTREGAGTRSVRGSLIGIAGGAFGGLLFTTIMVSVGGLPAVARLVGANSAFIGFIVHLFISVVIGISYGLLFQREVDSYGAGLGWGMLYGFFWWVWGALTLYPLLLRQRPDWSLDFALTQYASLVGHLLYGAGLGLFFRFLAWRYDAVYIERGQLSTSFAAHTQAQQRRMQSAAPALWAVTLVLGVILPLLLGE